jgi:hypothetical protein
MWDSRPRLSSHRLEACVIITFYDLWVSRRAHARLPKKVHGLWVGAVREPPLRVAAHRQSLVRRQPPLIPAPQLGQQPEHLEIEPDQGDHEAEGPVPLHVFGGALGRALLDEIEVQDQVQGRNHHHE